MIIYRESTQSALANHAAVKGLDLAPAATDAVRLKPSDDLLVRLAAHRNHALEHEYIHGTASMSASQQAAHKISDLIGHPIGQDESLERRPTLGIESS